MEIPLTPNSLFALRSAAPKLSPKALVAALTGLIETVARDKGWPLTELVCENPELEREALEQFQAGNFLTTDEFVAEIQARQRPVTGGLTKS